MIDTDPARDWGPTPDQLTDIARRSGCVVQLSEQLGDSSMAHELVCPCHEAKVRLLANLAEYDAKQPELIRLAERLAALGDGDQAQIAAIIHAFIRDGVRHLPEVREKFQPTGRTLSLGFGDCDDSARAVLALLRAAGLRGGLATLGNPPRHVAAVAILPEGRMWLDASLPARPGEHPLAAARRLGMRVREDLAQLGDPQPTTEDQLRAINLPNLITIAGYAAGVAWTQGAHDLWGVASIVADELDGYAARRLGQETEAGSLLDWGSDLVLTALAWQRLGLPMRWVPAITGLQVAARSADQLRPTWGSVRAALMAVGIVKNQLAKKKRRRRARA